jgi:hypothetical protein
MFLVVVHDKNLLIICLGNIYRIPLHSVQIHTFLIEPFSFLNWKNIKFLRTKIDFYKLYNVCICMYDKWQKDLVIYIFRQLVYVEYAAKSQGK